ncbi:MAG: response regulator transcription factor [Melioribacteraceae bacterium]|nr:response regulator transcription factor [Melioribacteraceae bacterium]
MITIAIVEDNETIRNGLKEFISVTDEFRCIADFSNCEDYSKMPPTLSPDVILMDINLPGISGIEGIKEIRKIHAEQKTIILTIHAESENLFEALIAGAYGYIEKKTPPLQMLKAIKEVSEGRSKMNTYIARKALKFFSYKKNSRLDKNKFLDNTEFDILKKVTEGKSPLAIADDFKVHPSSVYSYFFNIYGKLHLTNKAKSQVTVK